MTWNYRILRHDDGMLAIHEVYYNEKKKPYAYALDAVAAGEDIPELIGVLSMILNDIARSMNDIIDTSSFSENAESVEIEINASRGSGHEHA